MTAWLYRGSRVHLIISGYGCSHDEVTNLVGMTPTRTWDLGKPKHPKGSLIADQNIWRWTLELPEDGVDLGDVLDRVVERIDSRWVARLRDEYGAELDIGIVASSSGYNGPGITIRPAAMKRLGELGIVIDCDLYCQGETTGDRKLGGEGE